MSFYEDEKYIVSPEEREKITAEDMGMAKSMIPIIQKAGVFCLDMEYSIFREDGEENLYFNEGFELHGCSFAARSGENIISHYFRTREAIQLVMDTCFNSDIIVVAHNAKADYVALKEAGYIFDDPDLRCTMLGYNLLDESKHSNEIGLKVLIPKVFNVELTDFGSASDKGLDSPEFIKYACEDSYWTLQLYEYINKYIEKLELSEAWRVVSGSIFSYGDAERFGVNWNPDTGEELYYKLAQLKDAIEFEVESEIGAINMNSDQQVRNRLFNELGISSKGLSTTNSGLVSVDAKNLSILAQKHPIAELIVAFKTCDKLIGELTKYNSMAVMNDDGRIHATFWLDSNTGRCRCTNPNIQQVSNALGSKFKHNKKMKAFFNDILLRSGFDATEGRSIIVRDFSALEYRLAAAYSKDEKLLSIYNHVSCESCGFEGTHHKVVSKCPKCGALNGEGLTHGKDYHIINRDIANAQGANIDRKKAKSVSFLCLYGGSAYALAMTLGMKKDLAQKIITAVLGDHSGLKRWHKSTKDKISKGIKSRLGTAETRDMFGRRRKVKLKGKTEGQIRHESNALLNFPTQSTGSSVTGLASQMFRRECIKRGIWGLGEGQCVTANLIHDELVVDSCDTIAERANNLLKYCMENCVDLGVPLYSEGGIEKNWAEAK